MTRILFIPDVSGVRTSERTPLLYRSLEKNHEVVGVPAALDRWIYDPDRAKLPRYLLYVLDKALLAWRGVRLARLYRSELVVCATSHHALPGLIVARILGIRCLWDSQGNVRLFAESVGKGAFFTRMSVRLERLLGRGVDTLLTVSERDAEAYVAMGVPREKIHIIPISVVLSDVDTKLSRGSTLVEKVTRSVEVPLLLFFGSFKYAPNREALTFLNDSLAPALESEGVRCQILIAGRDIPDGPFHPFLRPLGFVHEIHELLAACDLCLVPIWKGVGILTKVLDAMAAGTPVVLTDFVARIIPGVEAGVNAYVASSEHDFGPLVVRALSHLEESHALAEAARKLVEERYDWGTYREVLEALLLETVGTRGGGKRS